jgi:hypothetical protein
MSATRQLNWNTPCESFSCAFCGDLTCGFPFGECTTCPGRLLCEACHRRHINGSGIASGHEFASASDDGRLSVLESLSLGLGSSKCTPHAFAAVRLCLTCVTLLCELCISDHSAHATASLHDAACAARTRLRIASSEAISVIGIASQSARNISIALDATTADAAAAQAQADINRDEIIAAATSSHFVLTQAIRQAATSTALSLSLEKKLVDDVFTSVSVTDERH